jgi:hypothetical protein
VRGGGSITSELGLEHDDFIVARSAHREAVAVLKRNDRR